MQGSYGYRFYPGPVLEGEQDSFYFGDWPGNTGVLFLIVKNVSLPKKKSKKLSIKLLTNKLYFVIMYM